jgi:cytochrome c biogenesis protein CcmG, thiol:disulfide interchange protein DsbE
LLIKDVASAFGDRVQVVTEEYGNSPTAQKWGVRRYPVVFVDDVLVARPKDFGFSGQDDTSKGLYVPWREPASQERFKADLRRMVEMRLRGEHVAGLNVDEVRMEATPADGPPTLPALSISTVAGGHLDTATLAGKVVVVEMWATWCPPCRSTLAWLNTLKAKYGDRVAVIAVAVDSPAADVRKMTADLGATYHVVQGTPDVIAQFGEVAAVPKLFVFDRSLTRARTFYGAPPDLHEKIGEAVDRLLR